MGIGIQCTILRLPPTPKPKPYHPSKASTKVAHAILLDAHKCGTTLKDKPLHHKTYIPPYLVDKSLCNLTVHNRPGQCNLMVDTQAQAICPLPHYIGGVLKNTHCPVPVAVQQ